MLSTLNKIISGFIAVQNIVEKVYDSISESKNYLFFCSNLYLASMLMQSSKLRPPLRLRSHPGYP